MAVVRDYYSPEGCHIIVHDDCYRDKTSEETQAVIHRVSEIIWREEYRKHMEFQKIQTLGSKTV